MSVNNFIQKIIQPPARTFDDYFEEARYLLSYRMCLFLSISLGLLTIILFLFYNQFYSILTFTGFVSVFISFFFIRITGKYQTFALSFNLFAAFLCEFTLYAIKDHPHIIDGLWMIINVLFAFLTVSKRWAIAITAIHTISLSYFYLNFYNEQIVLIKLLTQDQVIGNGLNIIICFSVILFLCWQSLNTSNYAQVQLKRAKETLQNQYNIINKQNIEKTAMVKEIHHRVKNNLQVIVSLLRLQSHELENEEAIEKFRDTTSRVLTMSLIHEKMYQTEELSKINIEEYFRSLARDLIHSYQIQYEVKTTIQCSIEKLGLKPIVPLALIINELFSNSLKYAFNDITDAKIDMKLNQIDEDTFSLEYSDNGQWKKPIKEHSFGLSLIESLTDQLDGTISFSHTPKTTYKFTFKNSED
ncbi:MAG: sensor histidine kinase [Fluviicola sp.]|jgi:two-component sensor histidine kinase|nr:sensor histidine kinase [Fluviicola sp.]